MITSSFLRCFRFMPISHFLQFHEHPAVIAAWYGRLRRILKWMTPFRRRMILAIGAVCEGCKEPLEIFSEADQLAVPRDGYGQLMAILGIFGLLWLCYQAALRFSRLPAVIRRHPLLTIHSLYWAGLVLLWNTTSAIGWWRSILLGMALVFPFLLWRCGYMLLAGQHGRMTGTRFSDHLLTLWPIYGGSNTPYGKGLVYLSRCEAKNGEELARSQLAGFRLLLLCQLLRLIEIAFKGVVYGPGNQLTAALDGLTLGIPLVGELARQGGQAPWLISWAGIYCELVRQVLHHAIRGNEIVGILRLFGFNIFRNTYKPLLAESVVEFWNRYYYYFKELLANFFFMPVFSQLGGMLREQPRLRLFLAVMAAAFLGNMYYHLLQHEVALVQGGIAEVLYNLRSRAFYCLLLAVGIYFSMLREQRRGATARSASGLHRLSRIAGVWTFFSLIMIWNIRSDLSFHSRMAFFLGLFGLA